MKTTTTALNTLLASGIFEVVEAYAFTLANSTLDPLYYTSLDVVVEYNSHTFEANKLLIARGGTSQISGLEVDEMELTISAKDTVEVGGVSFLQAVRLGLFDGATVKLEWLFYNDFSEVVAKETPVGAITWFNGSVSDVNASRTQAIFKVKDIKEKLDVQWPRNVYKSECGWQLYDDNCGLTKNSWRTLGTVAASPAPSVSTLYSNLTSQADGYYDLGYIEYVTGDNTGILRTVKTYKATNGQFSIVPSLPNVPASGDTFYAYAGCPKTKSICNSRYSNLVHYRGMPYIPEPETAT